MLKFVYKDKEYSWDEWRNEYNQFVDSLELPDDITEGLLISDMVAAHDIGYSIAMDKTYEIYELIASARFALINAYQKYFESNILAFNNPYKAHLWLRSQYLKNSIVWYNSCEDYIYQVLWFGFELHRRKTYSPDWYESVLRDCTYPNVKQSLEQVGTKEANDLLDMIKDYRFDPQVKYMRDNLANNIKHRANLQFLGLERRRLIGTEFFNADGSIYFTTDWIQPIVIDIDETVDLLKDIHGKLVNFTREIIDFMNFDQVFERDKDNVFQINRIRDKSEYRKIIIE
ncbi:hypothetical protein T260_15060 [Geobacillus thermopakistaniensis]|uniref:Uncharacterized protein n=1 Tax=Geobacillus thermopakistaniensis (strain MAS1) TaxID=1408282 RepID=A0A7U9P600_GEOTM|nr:hypothetical protein [Geobacillus sp. MAS1]ESU71174.1 hypothetical protein T260_15060 [Geobacillus sp. MAS1]